MAEVSPLTPQIKSLIGVEWEPIICEVEKGGIRRFAQAIEDRNPLWQDEQKAKQSRYGGIIAPPTFIPLSNMNQEIYAPVLEAECPLTRPLNAGCELEFFEPIRPGDTITVVGKLVNAEEKAGKMGKMLLLDVEMTFTNERGDLAAKARLSLFKY